MNIPLLLLQIIISIIPLALIKKYILNGNMLLLVLCLLFYTVMIAIYIKLLRNDGLSKVYTLVQILQVILVVLMGILFFNEKLSLNIIIGLLFGIVAIYLLN
jgi:multidrug transporter EmrE-like cation transporter